MNWGFWAAYLIAVGVGLWGGWKLRGVWHEVERDGWGIERAEMIRQLEIHEARRRHPAYRTEKGTYFG